MCLICVKFNQDRDLFDALDMINAAKREPNSIDANHLAQLPEALAKLNHADPDSVLVV